MFKVKRNLLVAYDVDGNVSHVMLVGDNKNTERELNHQKRYFTEVKVMESDILISEYEFNNMLKKYLESKGVKFNA